MTDAPRCVCGQPSPDATICMNCTDLLATQLRMAGWLDGQLDITIARLARTAERDGRGGNGRLPYDERAAHAKWGLGNELGGWVRVIGERTLWATERGVRDWWQPRVTCPHQRERRAAPHVRPGSTRALCLPDANWIPGTVQCTSLPVPAAAGRSHGGLVPDAFPVGTIPAMADYLLANLSRVRQHPAAAELADGITRAVRQAIAAVDLPPVRVYAGPCQNPECPGADLYTIPGRPTVACPACGYVHDVADQHAWMREEAQQRLYDHLDTASEIAGLVTLLGLDVTPERVRVWAFRGRLEKRNGPPRVPGGPPTVMYRLGDVLQLAFARDMARPA
jgi:hypothetical protein